MKNTKIKKIDPAHIDSRIINKAVRILRRGGLVVIPTETVYGIAADPAAPGAMDRLYEAKGRNFNKPVSQFADGIKTIENEGAVLNENAKRLANRFWPGPMTLVLPLNEETCGYRIPDHPVPLAILKKMGSVLAVTSANRSGDADTLSANEAYEALGDHTDLILDAGPSPEGIPSSVIDMTAEEPSILRAGAISKEDVDRIINQPRTENKNLLFVCTGNTCRSPMAEYLLRTRLGSDAGWLVASCGTFAGTGSPASTEAVKVLQEQDIELSPHRSQPLTEALVAAADIIVTMTSGHLQDILWRYPMAENRTYTLHYFGTSDNERDVIDPIGGSKAVYRATRDEIDAALADLIIYMKANF